MRSVIFFTLLVTIDACSVSNSLNTSSARNFTIQEQELIMRADTLTPMRVFKIASQSDSILLREESELVIADPNDKIMQQLIKRMLKTVTDSASLGVGIAAPQVGVLKRVILVQRLDKDNFPFEAYLNPVIRDYSKRKRPCREGCLSIPGRRDTTTTRSYEILVAYDRLDGSHHKESVKDFVAVIFQHEIDHLDGILYLDHLTQEVEEATD